MVQDVEDRAYAQVIAAVDKALALAQDVYARRLDDAERDIAEAFAAWHTSCAAARRAWPAADSRLYARELAECLAARDAENGPVVPRE